MRKDNGVEITEGLQMTTTKGKITFVFQNYLTF